MKAPRCTRRASLWLAGLLPVMLIGVQLGVGAPGESQDEPVKPTTLLFVRHAEKQTADPSDRDPALTEAGEERAKDLARLLSKSGVTHLFSTQLRRTRTTLEPLAKALGLEVEVIDANAQDEQISRLRTLPPGSVAVVAGHSNTVPAMAAALGGQIEGLTKHPRYGLMLGDDEYDRLFVVIRGGDEGKWATQTLELRYGD